MLAGESCLFNLIPSKNWFEFLEFQEINFEEISIKKLWRNLKAQYLVTRLYDTELYYGIILLLVWHLVAYKVAPIFYSSQSEAIFHLRKFNSSLWMILYSNQSYFYPISMLIFWLTHFVLPIFLYRTFFFGFSSTKSEKLNITLPQSSTNYVEVQWEQLFFLSFCLWYLTGKFSETLVYSETATRCVL